MGLLLVELREWIVLHELRAVPFSWEEELEAVDLKQCRCGELMWSDIAHLYSYELAYKANIEWVVFTCGTQSPF